MGGNNTKFDNSDKLIKSKIDNMVRDNYDHHVTSYDGLPNFNMYGGDCPCGRDNIEQVNEQYGGACDRRTDLKNYRVSRRDRFSKLEQELSVLLQNQTGGSGNSNNNPDDFELNLNLNNNYDGDYLTDVSEMNRVRKLMGGSPIINQNKNQDLFIKHEEFSELKRLKDLLQNNNLNGGNMDSTSFDLPVFTSSPLSNNNDVNNNVNNMDGGARKRKNKNKNKKGGNSDDSDDKKEKKSSSSSSSSSKSKSSSSSSSSIDESVDDSTDSSSNSNSNSKSDDDSQSGGSSITVSNSFDHAADINVLPFYSSTSSSTYSFQHPYNKHKNTRF